MAFRAKIWMSKAFTDEIIQRLFWGSKLGKHSALLKAV